MPFFKPASGLLQRVITPVFLTTVGATFVMATALFLFLYQAQKHDGERELHELREFVQKVTPQMVWNYDDEALAEFSNTLANNPLVVSIRFYDNDKTPLLQKGPDQADSSSYQKTEKLPLQRFNKDIGYAEVTFTTWPFVHAVLGQLAVLMLGMLFVVSMFLFLLQTQIKNGLAPLIGLNNRMGEASEKVGADVATLSDIVHRQQFSGKEISDAVGESTNSLNQLNTTLQGVTETLRELVVRTQTSDQLVGQLGEHSEKIQSILTTIVGVADNTNLLALNAAIEAARAGEAGRGFSVVADEVKKLSGNTVTAAREVESIINNLKGSISGVQKELSGMAEAIRRIEGDMQNVAGASDRQSATMSEINSTLSQFLTHFEQTETTISTNIVRLHGLISTVDEVNQTITGHHIHEG